jgi:uncharacterized low-complexity protein
MEVVMIRAVAAILLSVAAPAAAVAAPSHAQPEQSAGAKKFVLKSTIWSCGDAGCSSPSIQSRPEIACALLAKKVGSLRSFSVSGAAMPPADLEKCNSFAR